MVRIDSEKNVDFANTSPLGGGRPGRRKRKMAKSKANKAAWDSILKTHKKINYKIF